MSFEELHEVFVAYCSFGKSHIIYELSDTNANKIFKDCKLYGRGADETLDILTTLSIVNRGSIA